MSPKIRKIFLERIIADALDEHGGKVSIGGRNNTNLRFADDRDALAEEESELYFNRKSRQNLHTVSDGSQCREDQTDDK